MGVLESVVVFVMVWWCVFFMVLPIHIKSVDQPEKGHDTGAPQYAHIKERMMITTLIAVLITAAYSYALTAGVFDGLGIGY